MTNPTYREVVAERQKQVAEALVAREYDKAVSLNEGLMDYEIAHQLQNRKPKEVNPVVTVKTTSASSLRLHKSTVNFLRNYCGPVAFETEPAFDTMRGTVTRVMVEYDGKPDEEFVATFGLTSGVRADMQGILWDMSRHVSAQALSDPGSHTWKVRMSYGIPLAELSDGEHGRQITLLQNSTNFDMAHPSDCTYTRDERSGRTYGHDTVTR